MTEKPVNVRIASPRDEDELFKLLCLLHEENGLFSLNEENARTTFKKALNREGGVIGVIDGEKGLAGSVGFFLNQWWYSADWYLCEYWNFVHPEYRQHPYGSDLIRFSKWYAENMKMPLHMGIVSTERTEAKVRMYRREMQPIGAFFVHGIGFGHGPALKDIKLKK